MFDDLIKELKKLEKNSLSIPIVPDEEGFIDKECPAKDCLFLFKVNEEDWKNIFSDEVVYCPQCGHASPSNTWYTTEQIKEGERQAVNYIQGKIGSALQAGASKFNSRSQNGFLTIKLKVSGPTSINVILPITSRDVMEQKIQCDKCKSRYSVIGSSFFCPCCGDNSVERMFDASIEKVKHKLTAIEKIKDLLDNSGQKDQAAITCQSIIESSLSDCVTAFQRFNEKVYRAQPKADATPINSFQRLDFADKAWKELIGEGIRNWLTPAEYMQLNILFQKRHLLQHSEGIVDQRYLEKSQDNTYKAGQRIVVKVQDVDELLGLIQTVIRSIRAKTNQNSNTDGN